MSLRVVVLAVLSKEPNSGYGISKELRGPLRHIWEARLQQIYAELARAQEQGLVDVHCIELPNRPAKKVYTLTAAGEEALDDWLADRSDGYLPKDDLLVKLHCLERMPREGAVRQLAGRRERFAGEVERLEARLAQAPRTDPARLGELLTLEAALTRAQAEVSWCDRALAVLQEQPEPAETERRAEAAGA